MKFSVLPRVTAVLWVHLSLQCFTICYSSCLSTSLPSVLCFAMHYASGMGMHLCLQFSVNYCHVVAWWVHHSVSVEYFTWCWIVTVSYFCVYFLFSPFFRPLLSSVFHGASGHLIILLAYFLFVCSVSLCPRLCVFVHYSAGWLQAMKYVFEVNQATPLPFFVWAKGMVSLVIESE